MDRAKTMVAGLLAAVLGLLAVVGTGGFVYQSLAQSSDLARWPAPGRLFDVDGKRMHLYCQGSGSPTLVIEQGNGGYYDHWHDVNRELAELSRVCAYDRAGMGYSDSLRRAVRSAEVADRLQKLLSAAGITDDLLLVGWSAGGIHARSFFRQFPERVAGMILVDSSHEQQQRRQFDPAPQQAFDSRRAAAYLGPLGIVRFSGLIDQAVDAGPGSEAHKQRSKAVQNQAHWARAYFAEFAAFALDQAENLAPPSLGDLPLIVLSRGREVQQGGMPSYYTLEILQEREKVWQVLQQELAALSSQGRQVVASRSGHSIHLDQPELIVDAAREMLRTVRLRQDDSSTRAEPGGASAPREFQ